MIDFAKILNRRGVSSVLGLGLDGNRLEAVTVRRLNGSLEVQQTLTVPLALSPLTGDPELVGREMRNHLDAAGIRERRCAVCLPSSWVLTTQVKLPDLPEADLASFLQLEAERGFHSGADTLFIAESRTTFQGGEQYATLIAIPRNHLATLEKVLKAAQLKPLTFALGAPALEAAGPESTQGVLTLALGSNSFELVVTSGGGIVVLRSLDGAVEGEGSQRHIDADFVAREIRITLGQLPSAFGERLRSVKLFGRGDMAKQFVSEIAPRLDSMGLKLEVMERASAASFDEPPPPEIALSPALALAANCLRGITAGPELLPPKVSQLQQFLNDKFASGKLAWAGGAAIAVVLIVAGAFLFQQWQISTLQAKWKAMEPQVIELDNAQHQIERFRPWFDESYRGLRILKALTDAFPEQGSQVTAKTIEIRDLTSVTVTGVARDNETYLALLGRLRKAEEISDLKTDSVRGQAPLTFTFNFQWEGGGTSSGN